MTNQLFINGHDAFTQWGVTMGEGFLEALDTPPALKEFQKNSSRAASGAQYLIDDVPVYDERELTLEFHIRGNSYEDFLTKKQAFFSELQNINVALKVPDLKARLYNSGHYIFLPITFNLIYTGKGISYNLSRSRKCCKFAAKFIEPDPSQRTYVS